MSQLFFNFYEEDMREAKRLTEDQKKTIEKLYPKYSIREISRRMDLPNSTIHSYLTRINLFVPTRTHYRLTEEDKQNIIDLKNKGFSVNKISKKLNLSSNTVNYFLRSLPKDAETEEIIPSQLFFNEKVNETPFEEKKPFIFNKNEMPEIKIDSQEPSSEVKKPEENLNKFKDLEIIKIFFDLINKVSSKEEINNLKQKIEIIEMQLEILVEEIKNKDK